jgi:hypothetical protein
MWSSASLVQTQIVFQGGYYVQFYGGGAGAFNTNVEAYKPGGGVWQALSDARIKNVLGDYDSGLDDILALHPVRFTYKGNDTLAAPGEVSKAQNPDVPVTKEALVVPYPDSGHYHVAKSAKEFVGFIAQEVEALFPEMVRQRPGYIDGVLVNDVRDLDTGPLIFALVNSIKELHARIEALEAT